MATIAPVPVEPREGADVLLTDGSIGVIRTLSPDDRGELQRLHDDVSLENLRLRFFSLNRSAGHKYVDHILAERSQDRLLALGLWRHGRLLGLATAERAATDSAEVAFLVADGHHGLGIGTLLLEHLAALGRDHGVRRFTADVLPDNAPMLDVLRNAGFAVTRHAHQGVISVELETATSAAALVAADERDAEAEAASLAPLLRPRSVAVVGVRRDGTGVGAAIVDSIRAGGFKGELVAVHPAGVVSPRVPTYPSFAQVPNPIDLVVVAVPPSGVLECVSEAAQAGARAAVVVTSGFAELGDDGAALQKALTQTARDHDIRVVGPNCLGLLDNQSAVRLNATFGIGAPPIGGLAIASQSGGVGIVVLDLARRLGVGVRHFISLGNKADVSSNDLLAAWYDDPQVSAAALYLESFGSAAKFARVARRFSERKPLLAVVGGRSGGGQRAGASHTAAAATPAVRVDALLEQAGIIACTDAEDLVQTALLLSSESLPAGPRLAVLTNAGGMGVLAADGAAAAGLDVPVLSAELQRRLAGHVSGTVGVANPVDAGAGGSALALGQLTAELLGTREVDALLLVLVRTRTLVWSDVRRVLVDARRGHPDKTMVAVLLGGLDAESLPGAVVLPSVAAATRALGQAARYAHWRRTSRGLPTSRDQARADRARAWAQAHLRRTGPGWLGPAHGEQLLSHYGLRPAGTAVCSPIEAAETAARLGYPVALKVADPGVIHKTELGLVRTGLASYDEVALAAHDFARDLGTEQVRMLVQPMVGGVELAVGIVRDPGLGALVMVAAGGTATDLLGDRALLLAPVSAADAERSLRSLRIWPLLTGYRGAAPVDLEAMIDVVVAVGALADDVPEIAELDLNPVIAHDHGVDLVDVKVRLAATSAVDSGVPRRLRNPS